MWAVAVCAAVDVDGAQAVGMNWWQSSLMFIWQKGKGCEGWLGEHVWRRYEQLWACGAVWINSQSCLLCLNLAHWGKNSRLQYAVVKYILLICNTYINGKEFLLLFQEGSIFMQRLLFVVKSGLSGTNCQALEEMFREHTWKKDEKNPSFPKLEVKEARYKWCDYHTASTQCPAFLGSPCSTVFLSSTSAIFPAFELCTDCNLL